MTNKAMDVIYEKALQNGASGGKLLGVGGGGFFFTVTGTSRKDWYINV